MPSRMLILNGLTCLVSACGSRDTPLSALPEAQVNEIKAIDAGRTPVLAPPPNVPTVSRSHDSSQVQAMDDKDTLTRVRIDAVTVALAADASWLAAGTLGGVVVLEDLTRGERLWNKVLPEHARVTALATSLQAPVVAALAGHAPEFPAYVLHADTLKDAGPWGRETSIGQALALSEDGLRLATFAHDHAQGELMVFDLAKHGERHVSPETKSPEPQWKITLPPFQGALLAMSAHGPGVVLVHPEGALVASHEGQVQALKTPWEQVPGETPQDLKIEVERILVLTSRGLYQLPLKDGLNSENPTWESSDLEHVGLPLRGLWFHPERKEWLIVARPLEGGVVLYDSKGQKAGHLETGCRCDAHAAAALANALACVCDRPAEIRVGKPQW